MLWLLILFFGTACVKSNSINPVPTQASIRIETNQPPVAPDPILSKHLWVLSAVNIRGENMDVDALYPTYFRFDVENGFLLVTIPCEGTDNHTRWLGPSIIFQDEQHYTLIPNDMILPWCGDMIEEQAAHLKILGTSHYEIQDDKLILAGENIQIVLEKENSNP